MVCMVLTSLTVSVSATYTKPSTTANYNLFTFDGLETESKEGKGYNVGEFRLSNADGTDVQVLGTTTDNVSHMGMSFKKFEFKAGTLTGAADSTLRIIGNVHQSSKYTFSYTQGHPGVECFTVARMDTILAPKDENGDGTIERNTGDVVKYTLWAYSALPDGDPINFNIIRNINDYGAVLTVPASKLYSENGIPHKIDFVFYHTSGVAKPMSTKSSSAQRMELWIDGLHYTEGCVATTADSDTSRYVTMIPHVEFTPDADGVVTWKDSELYICAPKVNSTGKAVSLTDTAKGGTYTTVHTRANLHSEFFQDVLYSKETDGALHTGFVTGVDASIAEDIEKAYTTELEMGDKTVKVASSFYNAPASIWGDNTESNVSLVKISDGTVYTVADATSVEGTFEDYVISINNVYSRVEIAPVLYNVASMTAIVSANTLPETATSLQVVVVAYNANGYMEKIKVSEAYTDLTSDITYTIDDATFPTDADSYKVFVFDSLTSAKPLVEAWEE